MDEARAEAVPVEGRGPPQRQVDDETHGASPHGGVVRCTPYLTQCSTCPLYTPLTALLKVNHSHKSFTDLCLLAYLKVYGSIFQHRVQSIL